MLVKLKKWEQQAVEHAKRFARGWDYFTIASDSYSAGYRQAKEDIANSVNSDEIVEKEITDGLHQLSVHSFHQWEKENKNLKFKDALTTYLLHYNIKEIRVSEDQDGNISFQGLASKK